MILAANAFEVDDTPSRLRLWLIHVRFGSGVETISPARQISMASFHADF